MTDAETQVPTEQACSVMAQNRHSPDGDQPDHQRPLPWFLCDPASLLNVAPNRIASHRASDTSTRVPYTF